MRLTAVTTPARTDPGLYGYLPEQISVTNLLIKSVIGQILKIQTQWVVGYLLSKFKAALINVCILTTDQMTTVM